MNKFFLFVFVFFFWTKSFCIQKFFVKDFVWNIKDKYYVNLYSKILLNFLGNYFSINNINNIINCLYKTNYFDYIKIYKFNKIIFIYLIEKSFIYDFIFKGNYILTNDKIFFILNKFNIKKKSFWNNYLNLQAKNFIIDEYKKLGKYNIKIDFIKICNKKRHCILKINFNEGYYLKIRKIFLKKNKLYLNLNNNDLKFLNYFIYFNFNDLLINLSYIKDFYFKYGYFDFYFKKINFVFLNKNILDVFIDLYKGNRYKIYNIYIKNNIKNNKINIYINKIKKKFFYKNINYKYNILKNIIYNIDIYLKNNGFANFKINFNYQKLNDNKIILFLYIKADNIFYINKIFFKNINFYRNKFLYKNIPIKDSDLYNEYLLNLGKKNIIKSNIFSSVSWKKKFLKINNKNKLNIVYDFKENYDSKLNFGINYGRENNLNYELNLFKKNFFYLGNDILIKSIKNKFYNSSEIYFKNFISYLNNFLIKHKLFYNYSFDNQFNNYGYLNIYYGYKSYILWKINNFLNYNFGIEYLYNNIYKTKSYLSILKYLKSLDINYINISKKNPLVINDYLIHFNFKFNKLDNIIFPNYGFYINLNSKFTILKSTNNFYKIYFSLSKYLPLDKKKKFIFYFHNFIGYSNGLNNKIIPFYENFNSLGNNLRVFNNNISPHHILINSNKYKCKKNKYMCISPYYSGGNLIILLNNELIFPNFLNKYYSRYFRTSIFIDSGLILDSNWTNTFKNKINNIPDYGNINNMFKTSMGISLKLMTSFGILNLSYGFPLFYNENDEINNFQFNIGNFV